MKNPRLLYAADFEWNEEYGVQKFNIFEIILKNLFTNAKPCAMIQTIKVIIIDLEI